MSDAMLTSSARAETPNAARYLGQLCKHFAHKITVDYDGEAAPDHGTAHFPWGTCRMTATADALTIAATADDAEGLGRIRAVVDDHLGRFAWREQLVLDWTPPTA